VEAVYDERGGVRLGKGGEGRGANYTKGLVGFWWVKGLDWGLGLGVWGYDGKMRSCGMGFAWGLYGFFIIGAIYGFLLSIVSFVRCSA
jgi:hypothetical protein